MKSIIHIVGNRPQFIKLAVLYKELAQSGLFGQQIVHTGQHFSQDMSDLFFKELSIPAADINFNINNLPANQFIATAADALEQYFLATPGKSIAFVYGDTNTTLAAAMAAKRSGIVLVHFEAGVRTGDTSMPEEMNRIITDRLADVNLCCTSRNYNTMKAEGYGNGIPSKIYLTGDLMLDAFNKLTQQDNANASSNHEAYITCTIHRAANINNGSNLHQITEALNEINTRMPVMFPVHPNTRKMMAQFGCQPAFNLLAPVGYYAMKSLLAKASFVITDSGGTCREAYFLRKRSLIIMEKPFWPEIIDNGCALSSGADKKDILKNFGALAGIEGNFETGIFGDGNAAGKIKEILLAL